MESDFVEQKVKRCCCVIGGCDYCLFTELECTLVTIKMKLLGANRLLFSS